MWQQSSLPNTKSGHTVQVDNFYMSGLTKVSDNERHIQWTRHSREEAELDSGAIRAGELLSSERAGAERHRRRSD